VKVLAVIPARLASQRLSRKPLADLGGRPLIVRVWERVSALGVADAVVVATDSDEVAAACRDAGATIAMTDETLESGTHRVAQAVASGGFDPGVVVNVQGDEPFVGADAIRAAVHEVRSGWDVGTVATPVPTEAAWRDPAVVKVVRGDRGQALYFSRAPIPHPRDGVPSADAFGDGRYLRHVGVYAYTPGALARWAALPAAPLEETERLEQLRPLAAGFGIGVGVVPRAVVGVDTPEDLARARERWARGNELEGLA
jgi:3-deoxy-manno-octulosonate cytidylyltransferase (CMP-KDO synthetase)